jgi:hypothetical protein
LIADYEKFIGLRAMPCRSKSFENILWVCRISSRDVVIRDNVGDDIRASKM